MADVTLTHPELKDVEITRDADVARVLAKSGWTAKSGKSSAPKGAGNTTTTGPDKGDKKEP